MKGCRYSADTMGSRKVGAIFCIMLLMPLAGSIGPQSVNGQSGEDLRIIHPGLSSSVPEQSPVTWLDPGPWWSWTSLDSDRNGIHDSIQSATGPVNVGLSYSRAVTDDDRSSLEMLGHRIAVELPSIDALLIGAVDATEVGELSKLEGVVMVEMYGSVVFYGDIQTPAVKARNSSEEAKAPSASTRNTLGLW